MIELGKINRLKVLRKKDYGYYLDGKTSDAKDDILLPNKNIINTDLVEIDKEIEVFIYRDSQKRLVATQKKPHAYVGDVAALKVCDNTEIGSFVDIGLERDVLIPFREIKYKLFEDEKYPFYVYVDKTGRIAATTDIEPHLSLDSGLKVGDTCNGYVYGFQTNETALVCIEPNFSGIILREENYSTLKEGDYLKDMRVIRIYEDGKVGLSTRAERKEELDSIEEQIISYMQGNDGYMRFNDKSDPEDLRVVFNTSKKNFKRALGGLMKKNMVTQDEKGTWLL
ncbi:CvfB family protein [Peptostreptococcus faecalis]|uniref:CvfB family protein n=1 Tax=Peptostreptococcus faecalis TaxID=2045015 RepID=UPI000C7D63CF|nr:S1-like domain-containing RNA-binding protein [Peptostreptococcus faecalis]